MKILHDNEEKIGEYVLTFPGQPAIYVTLEDLDKLTDEYMEKILLPRVLKKVGKK